MFVGHYAVALAAKRFAPNYSLGWLFLAVQALDVLWPPLIILGIEHARVIPGLLPASSLDFYDIPWTHSMIMAIAWSWLAFRLWKSPVLGFCVFSHWLLDLIVHRPDLPVIKGGPYLGMGLWRSVPGTIATEMVLLVLGLFVYMRSTRPKSPAGKFAMPLFVLILIAIGVANILIPPPPSIRAVAIAAEASYIVLALIAAWLDRFREPIPEEVVRLSIAETA
jgi:hypothetical protein